MSRPLVCVLSFITGLLVWTGSASAFCGFYVAKADSRLFNKASEVAIARAEDKTVITMANDFKGDVKEFALVVPVPTVMPSAWLPAHLRLQREPATRWKAVTSSRLWNV